MLARGEIHDDIIASHVITVPEVRLSPDLKLASAYVVTLGGNDTAAVIEALDRNKQYIRAQVAQAVNLKFAPDIRFLATRRSRRRAASISCWPAPRSARTSEKNEHAARRVNPVHGWVVLDKPLGMTSTQAVGAVRRLFEAQKAGHAGTLDPLATGILPIALGEATKTVPFAVDGEKAYRFSCASASRPTRTTPRARSYERLNGSPRPTRSPTYLPISPARSARCRRLLGHQGGRQPRLRPRPQRRDGGARCALDRRRGLAPHRHARRGTAVLEAECGKGTMCAPWPATWAGRWAAPHTSSACAVRASAASTRRSPSIWRRCERPPRRRRRRTSAPCRSGARRHSRSRCRTRRCSQSRARPDVLVRGRDAPILNGAAYAHFKGRILALGELEKGAFRPTRVFNFG